MRRNAWYTLGGWGFPAERLARALECETMAMGLGDNPGSFHLCLGHARGYKERNTNTLKTKMGQGSSEK